MTVSEAEIEELRSKAEAAVAASQPDEEPWFKHSHLVELHRFERPDAAFIAALNPATVLRILDRLREAERLIDGFVNDDPSYVVAAACAFLSTAKPSKAKETA